MKAIFAVWFFGIMMHTSSLVSADNKCQQYTPMAKFDSSNFFLGTWFVTHAKNGPDSGVCRTYQASVKGTKINFNGDGYYKEGNGEKYYQVRCTGNKNNGKSGKVSLSCIKQPPTGIPGTPPTQGKKTTFDLDLTILDTDYGQYAIVNRCAKYPEGTKDNILVLHRDKNALKSDIASILQRVSQTTLNDFLARKNANCKNS
uniref:Putative salivary lipocalin n=1 Tax=Panstrongylus lignarius TaxID=156445 RepID=A0A224XKU0_9HEMI